MLQVPKPRKSTPPITKPTGPNLNDDPSFAPLSPLLKQTYTSPTGLAHFRYTMRQMNKFSEPNGTQHYAAFQ